MKPEKANPERPFLLKRTVIALFVLLALHIAICVRDHEERALTRQQEEYLKSIRVMFASDLINAEHVLTTGGWLDTVRALVTHPLLDGRVFVSIYENGSTDKTKDLLEGLREYLDAHGVPNSIVVDNERKTLKQTYGPKPSGQERIDYLSKVRNRALRPLKQYRIMPAKFAAWQTFFGHANDTEAQAQAQRPLRVVFANDVVITVDDVLRLLATQNGAYDAVCAMDYMNMQHYDMWVSRDLYGHTFDRWYPHVRDARSAHALGSNDPFRVFSCWGGMSVLAGEAFTEQRLAFRKTRTREQQAPNVLQWARKRFGSAHYLEYVDRLENKTSCRVTAHEVQSECYLIFKDMWEAGYDRVYVNPAVRTTYSYLQYLLLRWFKPTFDAFVSAPVRHLFDPPERAPEDTPTGVNNLLVLKDPLRAQVEAAPPAHVDCVHSSEFQVLYHIKHKVEYVVVWSVFVLTVLVCAVIAIAFADLSAYARQKNGRAPAVAVADGDADSVQSTKYERVKASYAIEMQ